jgi:hypothetical protein
MAFRTLEQYLPVKLSEPLSFYASISSRDGLGARKRRFLKCIETPAASLAPSVSIKILIDHYGSTILFLFFQLGFPMFKKSILSAITLLSISFSLSAGPISNFITPSTVVSTSSADPKSLDYISLSYDTDPSNYIDLYEWDFNGDGIYDHIGSDTSVSHTFMQFGSFDSTLRVTNNLGEQDLFSQTIDVFFANANPVANTGGPYEWVMGDTLQLNGSQSFDPDSSFGDTITSFAWDLNNDGIFGDASGETVTLAAPDLFSLGLTSIGSTASIGLQVMDTFGTSSSTLTQIEVVENYTPIVSAVPEPSTFSLAILGFLTLGLFNKRRTA